MKVLGPRSVVCWGRGWKVKLTETRQPKGREFIVGIYEVIPRARYCGQVFTRSISPDFDMEFGREKQ